jgi:glycosyltransferase involved in cell wall biosynthesis
VSKILAIVQYNYPGVTTYGGADTMLRDLLENLVSRGWQATVVILQKEHFSERFNGVDVYRTKDPSFLSALAKDADCLITHLGATTRTKALGDELNKPVVQLIHNTSTATQANLALGCDLAVFNSQWIRDFHTGKVHVPEISKYVFFSGFEYPHVVVRPPALERPESTGSPDGEITMINLTNNKNPGLFYYLAAAFPERKFKGVLGGYDVDKQVARRYLPNVRIQEFTSNLDALYGSTSVLLVPSKYESYSRVAVEAMGRGIPVIGSRTPGLKECLGPALPTERIEHKPNWEARLREVLRRYDEYSMRATERYQELYEQTPKDLEAFERALSSLVASQ